MNRFVLAIAVAVLAACEQKPPPPPISPTPIKVAEPVSAESDAGAVIAEDPGAKESCATRWQMRELTGETKHLDKAVYDKECISRLSAIHAECANKSGAERFKCENELSRGVFDKIEAAAKRNDAGLGKFLGTGAEPNE